MFLHQDGKENIYMKYRTLSSVTYTVQIKINDQQPINTGGIILEWFQDLSDLSCNLLCGSLIMIDLL